MPSVGQRRDRGAVTVLLAEFIDRTEVERTLRTSVHARWVEPLFTAVETGVALTHLARFAVELRRTVGTGREAGAATDAFFRIDQNKPVFRTLEMRLRGAHLHARRVGTLVAGNRKIVGESVLMPCRKSKDSRRKRPDARRPSRGPAASCRPKIPSRGGSSSRPAGCSCPCRRPCRSCSPCTSRRRNRNHTASFSSPIRLRGPSLPQGWCAADSPSQADCGAGS